MASHTCMSPQSLSASDCLQDQSTPVRFYRTTEANAKQAWQTGVALADRSHWGRLRLSGRDRLQFLHSQSTQDLASLEAGQGAETVQRSSLGCDCALQAIALLLSSSSCFIVGRPHLLACHLSRQVSGASSLQNRALSCLQVLVTPTGRTIDTAVVLAMGKGAMAIVSPEMVGPITERLQKHIFPMDDVAVSDVSGDTKMFSIVGPYAKQLIEEWAGKAIEGLQPNGHTVMNFEQSPVVVVRSSGLSQAVPGWTFIVADAAAAEFWRRAALKVCHLPSERGKLEFLTFTDPTVPSLVASH